MLVFSFLKGTVDAINKKPELSKFAVARRKAFVETIEEKRVEIQRLDMFDSVKLLFKQSSPPKGDECEM